MAVRKLCSFPCCSNYRVDGSSYCEKHDYLRIENLKKREEYLSNRKVDYSKYVKNNEHLYNTSRWRTERKRFLKLYPFCAVCCEPADSVDHIIPPRGNEELFWDKNNWQPLCMYHHNIKTREENKKK